MQLRKTNRNFFLFITLHILIFSCTANAQSKINTETSSQNAACSEQKAKILIVGMYHMNNPGQDKYNIEADDVLSAKRQSEINKVLDSLAAYKPTKIAIESAYRDRYWPSRYEQFLKDSYKLGRNEIEQIGFQLAKRLNHPTLYPIDFPMWMNGLMPNEMEQPRQKPDSQPKTQSPSQPKQEIPPYLARQEELIRTGTVTDVLRYLNSEDYIKPSHAYYMEMLLPSETIAIYEQTDLVTNWYKRNLRMFTNINRITDFPNDRILLIVGSGHLKILKDFAKDSPQFCLVEASEYLR